MRFDDLLAVRLLRKRRPDRRGRLREALAAARGGAPARDLVEDLVTAGVIDPADAAWARRKTRRYKRKRLVALYAALAVKAGVPRARLTTLAEAAGERRGVDALGRALVAAGDLTPEREERVRFRARLALDRDLKRRAEEWLAGPARKPRVSLVDPTGPAGASARFDALADLPASGEVEGAAPSAEQAAEVVASSLGPTDDAIPAPGFAVPEAVDTSDPRTGERVGRFRLLGRVGAGAMGVVYLALDPDAPGRPVAVKVLRPDAGEDARGRFKREIVANGLFDHPAALDVYDAGEDAGGHYLAMEYFPGRDLERVLEVEGRLTPRAAAAVVIEVLGALGAAHAAGVVHRDVKPENVLVSADRREVRLMDFGVAVVKDLGPLQARIYQTVGGAATGTPEYMSPEQAGGQDLDGRSDLYAVGVLLYRLLSGRLPFTSETAGGYRYCHLVEEPTPLREADPWSEFLPAALHDLLDRLLAKDPDARPPTAAAVRDVLAGFLPELPDA